MQDSSTAVEESYTLHQHNTYGLIARKTVLPWLAHSLDTFALY